LAFAVRKQRPQQLDATLVGSEAVVERLGQPVAKQLDSCVKSTSTNGVQVELGRGAQVGQSLDLLRRRAGLEVFPQTVVHTGLVGQPVVGVLPHDRVQVVLLTFPVAGQQPACLEFV